MRNNCQILHIIAEYHAAAYLIVDRDELFHNRMDYFSSSAETLHLQSRFFDFPTLATTF